eukprot:CAMPEP_0184872758 /NCGR_PEP_ID=MMETSP0580-20130426/41469_1 /TAXON_ID=1118495 /ORGANISM="Dactyliosolen fragilissimus" /LENGTH=484 /DNA_ID=CAMNT_0027375599 /DNA_START=117 /DNA_END=1571 /DNA_ORIENTATION=+
MILIIITVLPLNFAPFWFETLLVPMMKKMHQLVEYNWRQVILHEIIMLPWRIIDLCLFPGILSEEYSDATNCKIREDLECEENLADASIQNSTNTIQNEQNNESTLDRGIPHFDEDKAEKVTSSPKLKNKPRKKGAVTGVVERSTVCSSMTARSRVAASSMHLRRFDRMHRNISPQRSSKSMNQSPPDSKATSNKFRSSSRINKRTAIAKRSEFNKSTRSRRFSRDKINSPESLSSPESTLHYADESGAKSGKDKVRSTISLSEKVRTFFIGDSQIRLRDFLFDLDLPEVPFQRLRDSIGVNSVDRVKSKQNSEAYGKIKENRRHTLGGSISRRINFQEDDDNRNESRSILSEDDNFSINTKGSHNKENRSTLRNKKSNNKKTNNQNDTISKNNKYNRSRRLVSGANNSNLSKGKSNRNQASNIGMLSKIDEQDSKKSENDRSKTFLRKGSGHTSSSLRKIDKENPNVTIRRSKRISSQNSMQK